MKYTAIAAISTVNYSAGPAQSRPDIGGALAHAVVVPCCAKETAPAGGVLRPSFIERHGLSASVSAATSALRGDGSSPAG